MDACEELACELLKILMRLAMPAEYPVNGLSQLEEVLEIKPAATSMAI